jgi:hypothetical protein
MAFIVIRLKEAIILETAVGQARVSWQGVGWQGATTQRAPARKEEQRRQRAAWRLNRVCSAFTHQETPFVVKNRSVHGHFQRT